MIIASHLSWSIGDSAMGVHERQFPMCPFVRAPNASGNTPRPPSQIRARASSHSPAARMQLAMPLTRRNRVSSETSVDNTLTLSTGSDDGRVGSTGAVTPMSYHERLRTFADWPNNHGESVPAVTPERLARAGFRYAGVGDQVSGDVS
jgi:hypothetical protein